MRKWVPYPFVRFTFYLILGILAGLYLEGWIQAVSILAALSLAFYISLQVLSSRGIHQYYAFPIGICASFTLILLGYINVYLSDEKNNPAHLFHKGSTVSQQAYYYQAKVVEPLKEKEKSFSTLMEVEAMQVDGVWEKAAGKILLYVKKDSLLHAGSIKYGDRILINMRTQPIKGPMNPNAFDYRKFLRYQNIHFNAFASFNDVHILENDGNDLYGWALKAQQACAEIIRKNIRNKEATGIVLSLVLGFKDDLEQPGSEPGVRWLEHPRSLSGQVPQNVRATTCSGRGWCDEPSPGPRPCRALPRRAHPPGLFRRGRHPHRRAHPFRRPGRGDQVLPRPRRHGPGAAAQGPSR